MSIDNCQFITENNIPKRQRPDRAIALKGRNDFKESVVKVSFQKILIEKKIFPCIDNMVNIISKCTVKASLVFNRIIIHCFEKKIELPNFDQNFFIHLFTVGVTTCSTKIINDVWNTFFKQYPKIEKIASLHQYFCYAAIKYKTNFFNSLYMNFNKRQYYYIKQYCISKKWDWKKYTISIIRAINNWPDLFGELPIDCIDFIDNQKLYLNNNNYSIDKKWLKSNTKNVMTYFFNILNGLEKIVDTKRFSIAPLNRTKRHFITIDTKNLYNLLKKSELIGKMTLNNFNLMKNDHWGSIFKTTNLSSNKYRFSYFIETNGISASVHFKCDKIITYTENIQFEMHRVIAVDPGRCNIIFAVEKINDRTKTYKLTRGDYYASSGMNYSRNKNKYWQNQIKDAGNIYSRISPKTSSGSALDGFISNFIEVYDTLWNAKLEKKRARLQFKVYCLKRKKIDSFLQSWTLTGEQKPLVLYGAAKFNCTGKGEKAVPVSFVAKRCANFYKTEMIDEFCTTKVCCECNERTYTIDDNGKSIRGLRWCSSTKCRRFFDRDLNAALNILRCPASHSRPNSLSREYFNGLSLNEKLLLNKKKTLFKKNQINDSTMTKVHSILV